MEEMETKICVDTTVLVDFLRNKKEAIEWIDGHKHCILATTTINLFELYLGAYLQNPNSVHAVQQLAQRLLILNLSDESSRHAGEQLALLQKSGQDVEFRDVLIGSIAATENFAVKTNNKKHFSRMKDVLTVD